MLQRGRAAKVRQGELRLEPEVLEEERETVDEVAAEKHASPVARDAGSTAARVVSAAVRARVPLLREEAPQVQAAQVTGSQSPPPQLL